MDGQDLVNITVMIAGRPFPLKIRKSDESAIRQIAVEVNDKIKQFQLTYKNKDKQDWLCMTALTYAVDLQKLKFESQQDQSIPHQLAHLEYLLDQMIENQ